MARRWPAHRGIEACRAERGLGQALATTRAGGVRGQRSEDSGQRSAARGQRGTNRKSAITDRQFKLQATGQFHQRSAILNQPTAYLQCIEANCEKRHDIKERIYTCSDCGGLLDVDYEFDLP